MVPAPAPTRSLAADRDPSRCSTERKAWTPPRAGFPTTAFRLPRAARATPASRRCSCRPSTLAASTSVSSVRLEPRGLSCACKTPDTLLGKHLAVNTERAAGHGFAGESRQRALPGLPAQPPAQLGVAPQALERRGQGGRVRWRDDPAALFIPVHPGDAVVQVAAHHRPAAGHRFDVHEAKGFGPGV